MTRLLLIRRKSSRLLCCGAFACGCLLSPVAQGSTGKSGAAAPRAKETRKEAKLIVTGSRIPQKAERLGRIPTTHFPVVIIGRQDIARSGQATITGVLTRQPAFR